MRPHIRRSKNIGRVMNDWVKFMAIIAVALAIGAGTYSLSGPARFDVEIPR